LKIFFLWRNPNYATSYFLVPRGPWNKTKHDKTQFLNDLNFGMKRNMITFGMTLYNENKNPLPRIYFWAPGLIWKAVSKYETASSLDRIKQSDRGNHKATVSDHTWKLTENCSRFGVNSPPSFVKNPDVTQALYLLKTSHFLTITIYDTGMAAFQFAWIFFMAKTIKLPTRGEIFQ